MPRTRRLFLLVIVLISTACESESTEPSESAPIPSMQEQGETNCYLAAVTRSTDQTQLARLLGADKATLSSIVNALFPSEPFKRQLTDEEFKDSQRGCLAGLELADVDDDAASVPEATEIVSMLEQACRNEILAVGRANPNEYLRFTANALDAKTAQPDDVAEAFVLKGLAEAKRSPFAQIPRSELTDACAAGFAGALDALGQ